MLLAKHIAAFTNAFGEQNAEVILPFSAIDWKSEDDRNQFLNELVTLNDGQPIGAE
jgi:hypothetical protein